MKTRFHYKNQFHDSWSFGCITIPNGVNKLDYIKNDLRKLGIKANYFEVIAF
jgi:hypothetical protein